MVEINLTSKWLAENLGKNEATISRWYTKDVQPTLPTLVKVTKLLNVSPRVLICE